VAVMLTMSLSAQVGVLFGYSDAFIKNQRSAMYSGFNAGVSYDLPIANEWTMQTGLIYSRFQRSFTEKLPIGSVKTHRLRFHFLEIPIQPAFNMQVADELKIFVFAGPTLSFNVVAQETEKFLQTTNTNLLKGDFSPFNLKAGAGAGAQYRHLRLKAGYDWGLLNQYTGVADGRRYSSREFYIAISYVF